MKRGSIFLLASCLVSCGLAKPATVFLGYQDSLGQYSFGYSAPGSARSEVRTSNGATRGAYSYVDESGVIQTAQYVADGENGFRVVATNLPQAPAPVQDTAEVVAARAAHLQAVEMAKKAEESAALKDSKLEENSEVKSEEKPKEKAEAQAKEEVAQQIDSKSVKAEQPAEKTTKAGEPANSDGNSNQVAALHAIPSHVVLPQIVAQPLVPVFRVSHGNHEIEPSGVENSASQGSSITPAGTTLARSQELSKEVTKGSVGEVATKEAAKEEKGQKPEKQIDVGQTAIAPLNLVPLSSSYSSFVRHSPPAALHYVAYDII